MAAEIKPKGMATAVQLAGGAGDLGLDEPDQEDMFAAETDLPLSPAPVGKSGPKGGRPVGARNKSTEALRQLFLARYRSPLMAMGEIYSRTPEQLARELRLFKRVQVLVERDGRVVREEAEDEGQLDLERAFAIQQKAMETALPYVHSRMPQAVTVEDKSRGLLVINMGDADQVDDAVMVFDQVQQNQQVIDAEPVKSDGAKSETEQLQELGAHED